MITSSRKLLFTCSVLALACASAGSVFANPEDGVVAAGSAAISQTGKNLDIIQHSDKVVIDWRGFDIAPDETTTFYQPGSDSIALNRVNTNKASNIEGKINANGNVVIINQNGVMFGAGAKVDVNGLVVSTADITNENFMNGNMKFDKAGNPDAQIINAGTITAKDAGLVGFVAPQVQNSGVIVANLGRIHLASGDKATVDFYGDGLMEVETSDDITNQVVKNTGTIQANGGKIALTASAGKNIVNSLIQTNGILRAQSVQQQNGEITIAGASQVGVSGIVDASGKQIGETGGSITVTGEHITLINAAKLDASGHNGGGNIRLGGDYQGKGVTPTSKTLSVNAGATITNDAITSGNGGRTILWSDGDTVFKGLITARGGQLSGDGGFAEVSGKGTLLYDGLVDLSASAGEFGNLLLDPTDITISNAASSNTSGTTSITGTAATSNINVSTLQTQLASANVTISTASAYAGSGDITVVDALSWTSARTLTLTADRDVNINATITGTTGSTSLTINSGRDINFNSNVSLSSGGNFAATATRDLTVASGVTISSSLNGAFSLRAAGGTITNPGVLNMNGILNMGSGGIVLTSGLDGSGNRVDLTLNDTNLLMSSIAFGGTNISGFRDITIDRDMVTFGNVAITANRNLTLGFGKNITNNTNSNISLKAANGVATDLGLLTLNGAISMGTGTLALTSGVDGSGNRSDLTLSNGTFVTQGATIGATTITGFRDITIDRNIASSSNLAITAYRDLKINSGMIVQSGSAGSLALSAAGGVTTGTGQLILGGVLSAGSGGVTLVSGIGTSGYRTDYSFTNSNFLMQGATIGSLTVSGFRDLTLSRDITTAGAITINTDEHLTVSNGVTLKTGSTSSLSLVAAGGVTTNLGMLSINGILNVGSGNLTLTSGVDYFGNRPSLTLNGTNFLMQGGNIATTSVSGFNDINLNTNLAFTAGATFNAYRNLTIGSGSTITSGPTHPLNLRAANGLASGIGVFTLNGAISLGSTSSLTIISGLDGSGNSTDLTLNSTNFLMQGATIGTPTLTGFRDININRDISLSSGNISITAGRNLTIGSGVTVRSGASGGITLSAAGGTISNIGLLTINGILNSGTSSLTLKSGVDGSGNRSDFTFSNANFLMQGATIGSVNITGLGDVTFNRDIASSSNIAIVAERNLTLGSGTTMTTSSGSSLSLKSAGGVITGTGLLYMNGILNTGTAVTLQSGVDSSGERVDLTLDNTNFLSQSGTFGSISITGFRDGYLNRSMTSSSSISVTTYRNLTVGSGAILTPSAGSSLTLRAANSQSTGLGILTLNGTINMGSGNLTLSSGVDGSSNRADLIIDNTNFLMQGATLGIFTATGFRDVSLNRNLSFASSFSLTANRNLTVGSGVTLTLASTASLLLKAAGGATNGTGLLYFNGAINMGDGNFELMSGVDSSGNRTDVTINNTNFLMSGSNIGGFTLTGFRDVLLDRDIISTGTIYTNAQRHLTVSSGVTLKAGPSGGLSLQAGGGNIDTTGVLNMNGILNVGTGSFVLLSGLDGAGNRSDLTINNTNLLIQGATVGATSILGFKDITVDRDLNSSANISIWADHDLTLASGRMLTTGITSPLSLRAGAVAGTGSLKINGIINLGTGTLALNSGSGTDLVFDNTHFLMQGASVGAVDIWGFRDITLSKDLIGSTYVTVQSNRNLTVSSGTLIQAGIGNSTSLSAAGGDKNNQGILTLNGKINAGEYFLTLISGLDGSGHRGDLILDATHFAMQSGLVRTVDIAGFRDIDIETDLRAYAFNSSSYMMIDANRDLIIGANATITGKTKIDLIAGRNFINNSSSDAIQINSGGQWLVYSTSPRSDITGGLAYDFRNFGCTYGGGCSLGVGNGFVYSQSQSDYDSDSPRPVTNLPSTFEYASQAPMVTYTALGAKTSFGPTRDDVSIYTIDDALAQQLQFGPEETIEN